jgi:DUF438 domain-containing protein
VSTHGGKRPGAGRQPVLTHLQRQQVGAECENRWDAEAKETTRNKILQKVGAYHKRLEEMNIRSGRTATETVEEVSDDIDAALVSRTVSVKRPRGKKAKFIEEGRNFCRDRYGIDITARTAKACWDEYRQWLAKRRS